MAALSAADLQVCVSKPAHALEATHTNILKLFSLLLSFLGCYSSLAATFSFIRKWYLDYIIKCAYRTESGSKELKAKKALVVVKRTKGVFLYWYTGE